MSGPASAAPELLRSVGLMADGPARWGRPVPARGAGIYLIELAEPLPAAPIELTRVGKWLERLPDLRLDGERPTSKVLAARLASLWLADARVLYVGSSKASIGGRVASLQAHVLGDRRPHADGQWLHALKGLSGLRIWWATTRAPEESLDAILDAFAATKPTPVAGRPSSAILLPWANTRRPTGEKQVHGITGGIRADDVTPPPPTRRVDVAPGDADGTTRESKGTGTVRRTNLSGTGGAGSSAARAASPAPRGPRARTELKREAIPLTADAMARAREELDQLTRVRRPEVVARIKAARELGDLKENSEYHAAREEQSFLEGRVRLLEDRLRYAVVIDDAVTGRVVLGSVVRVEIGGDEVTWTIVGTAEADPKGGRISTVSPVGAALLGATEGDEIEVKTPRGAVRYRVVSIS